MMKLLKNLLIVPILFLTSCVQNSGTQELHAFEGETILVLPPITKDKKVKDNVGRSLASALINEVGTDVRYAGDIANLKSALNQDNLMSDGQINMREASRIGKALNAQEIVCIRITTMSPYPPQHMGALIIVRTLEGEQYRQKTSFVNINLKNRIHADEFADFAGGELRGPLGDRFVKKTNVNAEAAMLSNDEFSKFVGYKIAKSILYMKKY